MIGSCTYLPEMEEEPAGVIITETRDYIQITPEGGAGSSTGLLIYPGGLVDPHVYLGLASQFARSWNGFRILIAKMPANLAVMDIKAAKHILKDHDNMDWVLAGHSLGGAMSCSMVDAEPELFSGLILMAAYPAESVDLSGLEIPVLSIMASEDQVVDWEKYEAGKALLPPNTDYQIIEGGNHAGFGEYGAQKGDGEATLRLEFQQIIINELFLRFFSENGLE